MPLGPNMVHHCGSPVSVLCSGALSATATVPVSRKYMQLHISCARSCIWMTEPPLRSFLKIHSPVSAEPKHCPVPSHLSLLPETILFPACHSRQDIRAYGLGG